jgi:ABC-type proline/glycine betaine transport system permease subunit
VEEGVIADAFSWGTFPDAIRFIGNHPHLLWDKTLEHIELSGTALGIALAFAVAFLLSLTRKVLSRPFVGGD